MKEKICSFCGHRDADSIIRPQIRKEIIDLIENQGIMTFYSGGMGTFDSLCENVVRGLKRTYPIKLYLIMPYITKRLNTYKAYYEAQYDDIIIPDFGYVHYKRAITERNKWMTEQSDIILCYVKHCYGGAYQMLCYAQQIGKTIKKLE